MGAAEMGGYAGIYQNALDYLKLELVDDGGKLFLVQTGQPGNGEVTNVLHESDILYHTSQS